MSCEDEEASFPMQFLIIWYIALIRCPVLAARSCSDSALVDRYETS